MIILHSNKGQDGPKAFSQERLFMLTTSKVVDITTKIFGAIGIALLLSCPGALLDYLLPSSEPLGLIISFVLGLIVFRRVFNKLYGTNL